MVKDSKQNWGANVYMHIKQDTQLVTAFLAETSWRPVLFLVQTFLTIFGLYDLITSDSKIMREKLDPSLNDEMREKYINLNYF